jgi:hypothetical protein
MERKHFLSAAAAIGAALAGTAVAAADPFSTPTPLPSGYRRHRRGELGSARDIQHARKIVERIIDRLQTDQSDYGGHKGRAIGDLQQARSELDLALQWDSTHPNTAVTPRPIR